VNKTWCLGWEKAGGARDEVRGGESHPTYCNKKMLVIRKKREKNLRAEGFNKRCQGGQGECSKAKKKKRRRCAKRNVVRGGVKVHHPLSNGRKDKGHFGGEEMTENW